MNLKRVIFPAKNRFFTGKRWTNICCRTLHLIGVAGIGGWYLHGVPPEMWTNYLLLTVASGLALIALELYSNGIWMIQLRGIATMIKLGLISLSFFIGPQAWVIIPVIIISGVISHAPANIRYYSVLHGRHQEFL